MAHAWMPGARRIRAGTDGGPLRGGAPRAVWLTLGTAPGAVSVQSAAARLQAEERPCHLVWDPVTGEIAQLISILRAGRALRAADPLTHGTRPNGTAPGATGLAVAGGTARALADRTARPGISAPAGIRGADTVDVNTEGRVCVQIGVLGHCADPFTSGPLTGVATIVNWLDSWGVLRRWPAGRPTGQCNPSAGRARAVWALGGHFGASQVPGCVSQGPGGIDTDLLTGAHVLQVHPREQRHSRSPAVLPIPA
ncbi:MAG TPA: hypothetical protein VI365_01745 [Trebonia sp.]